ncbi:hypothetical protein Sfulv_50730 [Streptomyces fulvorobeus]|uniref:Flavoprotein domain-containing protein n=1 Tax=Streptomyces fulvorobeus TaxID=284028 RepID=A0A7J0CCP0_9ACTN|nr:hypothetical protein Sfulv_50730 [Streptomyces fulvorobeus]
MVIIPCSVKTLAGIRTGYAEGLIARAADVTLKERRRMVLVVRETPLSEIHLENMLALARMGASIVPPMPAFYNRPGSVDDIVGHIVTRVLDQFGIGTAGARRWEGFPGPRAPAPVPRPPPPRYVSTARSRGAHAHDPPRDPAQGPPRIHRRAGRPR